MIVFHLYIFKELKNITLRVANAIYIQEGCEVLPEFLTIGTNTYKSVISKLNFEQKKEAADKINAWVKRITDQKISDLVSSGKYLTCKKLAETESF